jgi:release factor glutamine methyltransferase
METWTVKRLLEWTTDFFKQKGIESARLEAEILLAAALKIKRIEIYTNFETEPTEDKRAVFRDFVKRRGAGEPVAYLVGFKEFYSLSFKVDKNVLIPRPETEQLVLEAIDALKSLPDGRTVEVCDVGTGSGAIAIALAKHRPKSLGTVTIYAVDLSHDALAVAEENAKTHGVDVRFVESDLLAAVPGPLDIIVSNPPYISVTEYDSLPNDVKNFEPKLALLAGPTGTEVIERLLVEANAKLNPGGRLLLEISPMIAERVLTLFGNGWSDVSLLNDFAGRQRIVSATKTMK